LYGGTQGIPATADVNSFLPAYAFADFKHDFGGDKITANVLNDIETVGSRATFFSKIKELVGKSPFEVFKNKFELSIPGPVPSKEYSEEQVLEEVAKIAYPALVSSVGKSVYDAPTPGKIVAGGAVPRNYTISRVLEKAKPGQEYTSQLQSKTVPPAGEYVSLLSSLWAVSGVPGQRKRKFAIMYDAGTCTTSEIGSLEKRAITEIVENPSALFGEVFDKAAKYEVYFITSSENVRDPAPKITERTFNKSTKSANVDVYFLNDYGHHVRYDMFSKRVEGNQTSNLYSRYSITTVRDNTDKVRGTIDYEDGKSRQLDDIKRESEIESSTTNALSLILQDGTPAEVMSCFFLKRSGDWCQALCLLDKKRKYTIAGYGENAGKTTTLQALEDDGVEIMLMTHDRVLLAYAITLGLNVCFTNNRPSGHWIVYFKNADVFRVDDYPQLMNDADAKLSTLEQQKEATKTIRTKYEGEIQSLSWLNPTSIVAARRYAYVLANLIDDNVFDAQIKAIGELRSYLATRAPAFQAYMASKTPFESWTSAEKANATAASDVLGRLRNLLPNVQSTIDISEKFTSSGLKYPQEDEDVQTLSDLAETLTSQRPFKASHKNSKGKEYNLEASFTVIAERLIDDVRSAGVGIPRFPNDGEIAAMNSSTFGQQRLTRTHISILRAVYDIFKKAEIRTTARQSGGENGKNVTDLYFLPAALYAITQISIPLVSAGNPDTFGFEVQKHMTHYDRWKYKVIDPYVVTKEDRGVLIGAIRSANDVPNGPLFDKLQTLPYVPYLMARLMFLYIDLVYNDALLMSPSNNPTSDDAKEDPTVTGTPTTVMIGQIAQKMMALKVILDAFMAKGPSVRDLAPLFLKYETGELPPPPAQTLAIGNILTGIDSLYALAFQLLPKIPPYGYALSKLETDVEGALKSKDGAPVIVLLDPATMQYGAYEYTSSNAVFKGNQQVRLTGKPLGLEYFQNIATNIYVPMIPQPRDEKEVDVFFAKNKTWGGLRGRNVTSGNARTASTSRRTSHARLRRRARTRRTSRLRKHSSKSKTR
jgi:hypothetical protein